MTSNLTMQVNAEELLRCRLFSLLLRLSGEDLAEASAALVVVYDKAQEKWKREQERLIEKQREPDRE